MSSDPASSKEEDEKTKVQKIETKAALEALAQAFKKLDVNHDGSISKQEFVAGVMKDKEIQDILHMHMVSAPPKSEKSPQNSERRGSLKMREKDMKRRAARTRNLGIALEYFKRFDTDNSGAIDVNEFSTFFHSKDLENMIEETLKKPIVETKNLSQDDCKMLQQLFGILDSDESGLVSYVELCEGMGPHLANEMFSTMDEDGNKYLGFDEIIHALDAKFENVKEEDRVKKLAELADMCLKQTKRSIMFSVARTRRPARVITVADTKKRTGSPLSPKKTLQNAPAKTPPTDMLKEYAKKIKGSGKSILDTVKNDLGKLTE